MKTMAKICLVVFAPTLHRRSALGALMLGIFLCFSFQAKATDDPFELETGHWMSFDHYKDADKRGTLALPVAPVSTEDVSKPAIEVPSVPVAAIAAPTRPINLPTMPGLNKGFNVKVNTTEDEQPMDIPAPSVDLGEQNAHFLEKNWQSPNSALGVAVNDGSKPASENGSEPPPLDVRLSYLPDVKVAPQETAPPESGEHKARIAFEKGLKPRPVQKEVVQPAVCAALDAFKKQQLTAIQSDRQTLQALQDAISTLGLQKQLGFMTEQSSALNSAQTGQANIDIPSSTTVR